MQFDDVTLFDERVYGKVLDTGEYALREGCKGEITEPVEANLQLYVVSENAVIDIINDYQGLSRYVRNVRSNVEAEAYIRLLTSLDTFYLFCHDNVVIDCKFVEQYSEPVFAQVTQDDAIKLDLHPLDIKKDEVGYVVKRCLYVWEQGATVPEIHSVMECIGKDGTYRKLIDITIPQAVTWNVRYPVFE